MGGVLAALTGRAAALELSLPVDCSMGEICHIQQYPDRDPGPSAADYTCGTLSYEGHKGLDIRVRSLADMARGVPVLAAAAGTIRAARDGMTDIAPGAPGAPDITDKACGNGVAIDHGQGWETQYCHLRRGSIAVAPGDKIAAGAPIGLIGHSGEAAFPHVHFVLRRMGREIDPFDGKPLASPCGAMLAHPLWTEKAQKALAYHPGGALDAGFATAAPTLEDANAGFQSPGALPATSPNLVFWVRFHGLQRGDRLRLTLTGPEGEELAGNIQDIPRLRAIQFLFAGRKRPGDRWPGGRYVGRAELVRDHRPIAEITGSVTIP